MEDQDFSGEDRELEQTQLVLGIEGLNNIDVDRYSLRALAIILGGGMSSRLFQEIREKRGTMLFNLCFYADANLIRCVWVLRRNFT